MMETIFQLLSFLPFFALATLGFAEPPLTSSESDAFQQLQFRFLGPAGNRATSVVGEPDNPLVVYIGAASGGIFKTTDGGTKWRPIFDDQNVSAIGALAIAPSEPQTVWAGTGEPW